MDFRFDIILEYSPYLLKGTLVTIGLSLAGIAIGTILGLFIGLGKMQRHERDSLRHTSRGSVSMEIGFR